jgi:phosphatidylserine/phosphatidylglycerophosphate/cardiolipin synthase-like enzyme
MIRRAALPAALTFLLPILVFSGAAPSANATAAPAASSPLAAAAAQVQQLAGTPSLAYITLKRWAPGNTTPISGPSFNNPTKGPTAARRNIERIYRMIQSTKGYRVRKTSQCPRQRVNYPNEIKIALYSFSDGRIADALIRAHRRCIAVRVLMNDHLSNSDVPAGFGRLQRAIGYQVSHRSWARRCHQGCRGRVGPLHTKMYLFSRTGRTHHVVAFGSSNMTGKAANVQWNDIMVFKETPGLYANFETIFRESVRDRLAPRPIERNYRNGNLLTMFWPQPGHTKATDRVLNQLEAVRCNRRPTGGTGYNGHTAVSINIHAMEGDRGLYLAQYIVKMKKAGCRVRVLYGLIAPRIHRTLKNGGVPNRRTIFDRDDNGFTDMYTHMKYLGVNGAVTGDSSVRLAYTGSENFSQKTVGGDEVWMRMPRPAAWRKYQQLFDMIWNSNYYSNPKYAFYQQSDSPIHARTTQWTDPNALLVTSEDLED